MKQYKSIQLLACLILSLATVHAQQFSALRVCDNKICDIQIYFEKLNSTGLQDDHYMQVTKDYFRQYGNFVFCVRDLTTKVEPNNKCSLTDLTSNYFCVQVTPTVQSNVVSIPTLLTVLQSSASLTESSPNATTGNTTIRVEEDGTFFKIFLANITELNKIVELRFGQRFDMSRQEESKTVYFHTFIQADNQTQSQNLVMQRHYECFGYIDWNDFVNQVLVFYGGVKRFGDQKFIVFHILSKYEEADAFANFWGGISFSLSHASRDMIGFSSKQSGASDLYSLMFQEPYLDTANNINGTSNIINLGTTFNHVNELSHYFSLGFARKYDTLDIKSDQTIMKKMYQRYCLAWTHANTSSQVLAATSSEYLHNFISCWEPNISISEPFLFVQMLVVALVLIVGF